MKKGLRKKRVFQNQGLEKSQEDAHNAGNEMHEAHDGEMYKQGEEKEEGEEGEKRKGEKRACKFGVMCRRPNCCFSHPSPSSNPTWRMPPPGVMNMMNMNLPIPMNMNMPLPFLHPNQNPFKKPSSFYPPQSNNTFYPLF